jgi:organic hydroperoxide reductase OsmC/OhrA
MKSDSQPVENHPSNASQRNAFEPLIADYEKCVDEIRQAIDGLTIDELRARPIEGKWSTLEVVCHLADTEVYFTDRIERVIAIDNPLLMGVDERPYPERIGFQEQPIEEELELLTILRRRTARILRRQPEEAWLRTGVHSGAGLVTLEGLIKKANGHVRHHLPFIAEKRAAIEAARTMTRSPKAPAEYQATIQWKNAGPDFANGKYSRVHQWHFDGGITVAASPSPHVVPLPWSSESAVDPEEALVAAAASCHMLTFLWLASKQGWVVEQYTDRAVGLMTKDAQRVAWVSQIRLQPQIVWTNDRSPSADELAQLHSQAHDQCFIANSIKSRVVVN